MNALAWWLRHHAHRAALVLGGVLLMAALAMQALWVQPLEQRAEDAAAAPRAKRPPASGLKLDDGSLRPEPPARRLDRFYGHFAGDDPLADRLERLYAIAQRLGLELQRGEYRMSAQPDRKLERYQVVLPVSGSYPKLRRFVTEVLREMPTASLDQIQFQRKAVADDTVEAQISFTMYLPR